MTKNKNNKKKNKMNARKKMFKNIEKKNDEDSNFVSDVNNAEDVSSFVDDYISKLVDNHMHDSIDSILEDF